MRAPARAFVPAPHDVPRAHERGHSLNGFAAVQHSSAFVHEQFTRIRHSNRHHGAKERPRARVAAAMARKPRQIRLGERSRYRRVACCPQILWIKVCVSCKFGR